MSYRLAILCAAPLGLVVLPAITNLLAAAYRLFAPQVPTGLLAAMSLLPTLWLIRGFLQDWRPAVGTTPAQSLRLLAILPLILLLTATVGYLLHQDIRHDGPAHYAIAQSIARGNLPVHDLAFPANLLPYHYGFDALAGALLAWGRGLGIALHPETALDTVSIAMTASLLIAGLAVCVLLFGGLRSYEAGLVLALVTFGGGLVYLIPLLGLDLQPWRSCWYGAFTPFLDYVGRRPAVMGQVTFLLLTAMVAAARERRGRTLNSMLLLGVLQMSLAMSAEELLLAFWLATSGLLGMRSHRSTGAFVFRSLAVSLPLLMLQGGWITASWANHEFTGGIGALTWHAPSLPGWNLQHPRFDQKEFWYGLLAEVPPTVWLLPFGLSWYWRNREDHAPALCLVAVSLCFLVLPLFVTATFSPPDAHRLFLLPQLVSFLAFPAVTRQWALQPAVRRGFMIGTTAAMLVGPLLYSRSYLAMVESAGVRGRRPEAVCPVPPEYRTLDRVWLASPGVFDKLLYEGLYVLTAPFGTYGAGYYSISNQEHLKWHRGYLQDPPGAGATHAVLNEEDYSKLRAVAHHVLYTAVGARGEKAMVVELGAPETK